MESRRSLSTWLMLQRLSTGLQHVSRTFSALLPDFLFPFVNSAVLRRPNQVFWLWTWCSNPVWYQKWSLHRQWIPRGEQAAGYAWWVHQKICAVCRVWQPWNRPGKALLLLRVSEELRRKGVQLMHCSPENMSDGSFLTFYSKVSISFSEIKLTA